MHASPLTMSAFAHALRKYYLSECIFRNVHRLRYMGRYACLSRNLVDFFVFFSFYLI